MKKFYLFPLTACLFFMACGTNGNLKTALEYSGDNRAELEKVLTHYSRNEADSLKYKAAVFLIENMLLHYTCEIPDIEGYKSDLYRMITEDSVPQAEAKAIVDKKYGKLSALPGNRKPDLQYITADYLMRNIDHAFMVWETQPWGKTIPFSVFCEELLPYRVADEPLIEWREYYYNYFQPMLDKKLKDDNPASALKIIYDSIYWKWNFMADLNLPQHQGAIDLLDNRVGNCLDLADFGNYIMKALGIPGSTDIILHNPDHKYWSHYWNSYYQNEGGRYEWEVNEVPPQKAGDHFKRKKGKIYRQSYKIQLDGLSFRHPKENIPPILRNMLISDVTSDYFPGYNLTIPVDKRYKKEKLLYLCVFDNKEWIPVAGTEIRDGKADFGDVEYDVVYIAGYYIGGRIVPASNPILIEKDGRVRFLTPDDANIETAELARTFRPYRHLLDKGEWAIGGEFQGSNRSDFKDATVLHVIREKDDMRYKKIDIESDKGFRYYRYLSTRDSSFCTMAEIEFYASENEKIEGEIIGTSGFNDSTLFQISGNTVFTKEAVFDGNPISHYYARESSGAWAGMDFKKPVKLSYIWYQFLNDNYAIREGYSYELFYFDKDKAGMTSLGRKTAQRGELLVYDNVPENALLYLRNLSRPDEERIFTYENGTQRWF